MQKCQRETNNAQHRIFLCFIEASEIHIPAGEDEDENDDDEDEDEEEEEDEEQDSEEDDEEEEEDEEGDGVAAERSERNYGVLFQGLSEAINALLP